MIVPRSGDTFTLVAGGRQAIVHTGPLDLLHPEYVRVGGPWKDRHVTTSGDRGRPTRAPLWAHGTRLLEITTVLVIATATLVEFAVAIIAANVAGLVSAGLIAVGTLIGYRYHPRIGLGLVAVAPLLAAVTGWPPIHNWSIACFVVLLLTLRGLPGLLTGVVVGAANLAAVGWYAGSLSVVTNSEASIAAGAALAFAAAGSAIRGQRQYFGELEQRTQDAIATRQVVVDRSIAEERLRIARDLHDSIGHQIAVVSMHLGAAQVHLPSDPQAATSDLDAARTAVQSVLKETQGILQVLRVGPEPTLAPTPHHGRIPDLVESYRFAGCELDAHLVGLDQPLSQAVSTATFRVVQEALTNAERHGDGPVSLRVEVTSHAVSIEAVNRLRSDGQDTSGGGNGLVGMSERVASVGGTLVTGAQGQAFTIRASLPDNQEAPR